MKTIEINLFKFNELTDAAKEKARGWYREASKGDSYWSECTIEDAKQCAKCMGIEVEDIFFRGFWSQGDGACFTGRWNASRIKPGAMVEHAPQDKDLHSIAHQFESIAAKYPSANFVVTHRGHYMHENCTHFDCNTGSYDDSPCSDDAEGDQETAWAEDFPEDDLIEAAREFMRWIYRQLEKEYDYQNADEQVDESIEANEYEFTESGEIA